MRTMGSYDLTEVIAEGGMGTVYKARHRVTGELAAVKVVSPHILTNAVLLKRFQQEYNAARVLDHPNIVKAIEFGQDGDRPYLVMEYVEGESLGQRIERAGRLPESEAVDIITQVAQGLHKAHKAGLIHRDVKPDNVLLMPDGQAKLTDLGLVKELEADQNLTRTGRGLGTPHFMAPEQFRNAKRADVRCDVYSLAATLYMMVTGELPFKSTGPLDAWMKKVNNELVPARQLVPDLSERVDWAIRRGMSPDPQDRPENCRDFLEDLTGQATRKLAATDPELETAPLWYMVYRDEDGAVHTVKGTTNGIRRSLRERLLGDAGGIRIARTKAGPFVPLADVPDFADALAQAAGPLPQAAPPPAPAPAVPAPDPAPHARVMVPAGGPRIEFGTVEPASEWWKWVALVGVAVSTGVLGYFLMPMLTHLRLP